MPKAFDLKDEYEKGWRIPNIFPINAGGIKTHHDNIFIEYNRLQLINRFKDIVCNENEEHLRLHYNINDTSDWKLSEIRKNISLDNIDKIIYPILYRPFDIRFIYYNPKIIVRSRRQVMDQMTFKNLSLLCMRQASVNETYSHLSISNCITDNRNFYSSKGALSVFPLYIYNDQSAGKHDLFVSSKVERQPNLSPKFIAFVKEKLEMEFIPDGKGDMQKTFGPEDILHYAYAIFHSPTYRERYAEFLKIDFPRLPITSDRELFKTLANKGEELVSLHLMESPVLNHLITGFPISGTSEVEKVRYVEQKPGRVYINKNQYFDGIDPVLWKFQIGGYQVLHKWLNDRKGRNLSFDDLFHYQRIVIALKETIRLMKEIDSLIPKFPIE